MVRLIYESMLLGIVAWMIGLFYNYTLQNNAILGKIGNILKEWRDFPEWVEDAGFTPKPIDRFKSWIANPLGACIYCSTTWITIFIMILYWSSWDEPPKWEDIIICTLAAIGTQHIFVRMWCYIKINVDKANED